MRKIDLSGSRFGRLVALEEDKGRSDGRRTYWRCQCDCGGVVSTSLDAIRGGTSSCGCIRKETTAGRSRTHGHTIGRERTAEYNAWKKAKERCYKTYSPRFAQYGGRGIRMCDAWLDDFAEFFRDMGPRPDGASLDRVDVDGHYEPSNCRWATKEEQANNRQTTVLVTTEDGRSVSLKQFAAEAGVPYKRLHELARRRGIPLREAVKLAAM